MYSFDREFTNKVHREIVLEEVYNPLGWTEYDDISPDELNRIDMQNGIDYVMLDENGTKVNVQERFREEKYSSYNDVTLRYKREHTSRRGELQSKFFKIEARYLVYGVVNASKREIVNNQRKGTLIKYVVVDLDVLFDQIKQGRIKIVSNSYRYTSYISDGIMYAPVKENVDFSSNFVVFDVGQLYELFGDDGIILDQENYLE